MKTKLLITAIALFLALPAGAEFIFIENGYEVSLDEVRLPKNRNGTIAYKTCSSCDYKTSRVSPDVQWEIDGKTVSFAQFRKRAAELRGQDQFALVTQNIESKQVTGVSFTVVILLSEG
jgi:hypothetical protein